MIIVYGFFALVLASIVAMLIQIPPIKTIFSTVDGVVLLNGNPVPDAVVKQTFNFGWTDEEGTVTTKTDKYGKFKFPKISRFSIATSIFPHEPVISQFMEITHESKAYKAWLFFKRDYSDNGELNGKPINIICELTREDTMDRATLVSGICTY